MNFLASLSSAVISAGSAALAGGNGVPGLPAYTLGERVNSYQGKSIWTLYDGVKKVRTINTAVSSVGIELTAVTPPDDSSPPRSTPHYLKTSPNTRLSTH